MMYFRVQCSQNASKQTDMLDFTEPGDHIVELRQMPSFQDAIFPRRWLLVLHKMTYTIYSKKFKNINYYKILERKETTPTAVFPSVDSRVLWAKMAFLQKNPIFY